MDRGKTGWRTKHQDGADNDPDWPGRQRHPKAGACRQRHPKAGLRRQRHPMASLRRQRHPNADACRQRHPKSLDSQRYPNTGRGGVPASTTVKTMVYDPGRNESDGGKRPTQM